MWKIWVFFSIFKFSFSAPVNTKEDSVAAGDPDAALRCLLLATPIASCDHIKQHGNNIPRRLQKLYDKVKKPLTEIKQEELLDSTTLDLIPTSLLYLIPRIRLENMTGHVAGSILSKSPEDEALAVKLASLLDNDTQRMDFFEMLPMLESEGRHLSVDVEKELGRALTSWYSVGSEWQYWQFDTALMAGSPVLAHLPPYFLYRMVHSVAEKFLFHLRNWRPDYPNTTQIWAQHPTSVKRIWTQLALKKSDRPQLMFPAVVKYASYLLLGATPDEMPLIASYVKDPSQMLSILELDFDTLQARALFDILESNFSMFMDPKSSRHLLPNLLPRQIQQFDASRTYFGGQIREDFVGSLPTEAQLLQHQIAHLVSEKKLPNISMSTWKDEISLLGKSVHLLRSSSLEVFKNKVLHISTLNTISSSSLNFRQTRYLTNNNNLLSLKQPETILNAKHHLKGLPAHKINIERFGSVPDNVQRHLLKHIPTKSRAITSVLLEKTHLDLDDRPYLSAILENENYGELLKLFSSRDLSHRFRSLVSSLSAIASQNKEFAHKIRSLPSNVGAALLSEFRKEIDEEEGWTMENLIENPRSPLLGLLLSNLQCTDMELVNDVDVVPILGHYVRERKNLGLNFPKNMQYCCQKALTRYLKLKSNLRHWDDDSTGLLNLLELFEVRAVGGYILASLPLDVIQSAFLKNHIIREIGTLPLPELLTATSLGNLKNFAQLFGKHSRELHLREMTELGNLIWFLRHEDARRINPAHFRLFMELKAPEEPRAPCFTAEEREFWRELLIQAFGKPDSWSSGTLTLLGDLLFVFDEADLDVVGAAARAEAGDVLTKFTNFHRLVEWSGKLTPITYFEACVEALPEAERPSYKSSVRSLLRFYLESAEMLVYTVIPADRLLRLENDVAPENEALDVDSNENEADTDGRIKRSVGLRKGRISKRVLNENLESSAENRKKEILKNNTRALTIIEKRIDENSTRIEISETFSKKSMQISCDAIRLLGMPASFVLDEEDMKKLTNPELEDCAEVLGSLNLPQNVRKAIWPRLSKWKESNNLLEVGNLVSAIDESDMVELSLDISKPWGLESLAVLSEHVTDEDSLSMIADRFILGNPEVTSSLRFGTAAALGPIICFITRSRQQKLLDNPGVFLRLAPLLGASSHISFCVEHLINHAKIAYGPASQWSAEDLSSLGIIAAGLSKEDWHNPELKASVLSGLTPAAVSLIPTEVFKEFSEEQLSFLPALSVAVISPEQSSSLSPSQSEVLERVRRQIPDKDLRAVPLTSHSSHLLPSYLSTICVLLLAAVRIAV